MKKLKELKNNKVFKIISSGIKVIVSFLIIIIISIIFIQRVSNNKITFFGYSMFTIISESMVPKYEIGDMVIAKKVDVSSIEIGDDVVYFGDESNLKNKIVTHQVISKRKENGKYIFETKGIANQVVDPEIEGGQVYGVVIYKSKILSFLSRLVNNIYGFYFIIFVPFAILIFFELFDTINDRKLEKEKNKKDLNKENKKINEDDAKKPKKKLDLGD